jgi:hypothetical protein
MLVVKPNLRRMMYMRDSPSERGSVRVRPAFRLRWERVLLATGIAGVIVLGLIVLAAHY